MSGLVYQLSDAASSKIVWKLSSFKEELEETIQKVLGGNGQTDYIPILTALATRCTIPWLVAKNIDQLYCSRR